MTNIAIKFNLKGIHKDNIGKHLYASLHAAIARHDAEQRRSYAKPKYRPWEGTYHRSSSINLTSNTAIFTMDCQADIADMILAELLKDSSYQSLKGTVAKIW